MPATSSIHGLLRQARVPYTVVRHGPESTPQDEATIAADPGRDWATVVACFVDGEPVEAVLPAPLVVNLDRLRELAGGDHIRLAQEDELSRLFPECEPGATPPVGPAKGWSVFADVALAAEPRIVLNAGMHTEVIAVRWADFARSVRPIVGRFAEPPRDRVLAYRLSYRE